MPLIDQSELQELIAEKNITKMSIDTSVFMKCGFSNFEKRPVQSLKFYSRILGIVTPKIIFHEIANHYAKDVLDNKFSRAKEFLEYIKCVAIFSQEAKHLLEFDSRQFSREKIQNFFEKECSGVLYWPDPVVNMLDVYEDYIDIKPPFEENENKKSEFPDAFALRVLEKYAQENKTNIFVMSDDGGWYNFANTSTSLFMIDKKILIPKEDKHNYTILINNLKAIKEFDSENMTIIEFMKKSPEVKQALTENLSEFVNDLSNFLVVVSANVDLTEEVVEAKIQKIDFESMTIDILEKEDENYSFVFYIESELSVSVEVETYCYENIDKSKYKTGTYGFTPTVEHEFMVTMEAKILPTKNGLDPEVEILETEIVSGGVFFDFEIGTPWHSDPLTKDDFLA